MTKAGRAGQLAWTGSDSDGLDAIDGQAGLPGYLAAGPNLQVMSPRISVLGSFANPPSTLFRRDGPAKEANIEKEKSAGREAMQQQQQHAGADIGAGRDDLATDARRMLSFSSHLSSHVPQDPKGIIPCASREARHSLLSTSSQSETGSN